MRQKKELEGIENKERNFFPSNFTFKAPIFFDLGNFPDIFRFSLITTTKASSNP